MFEFWISLPEGGKLEAAIGFEPMNEGFADLCLSHLATPPLFAAVCLRESGYRVRRGTADHKLNAGERPSAEDMPL